MTGEIRTLLERDASAWWHLRLESLEREPFAFGKAVEEHRATDIEIFAARFRDAPESNWHLGAWAGDRLIGMATFLRDTGLKERHKGRIFGVYVTPAYRGTGVGRALIGDIVERARRYSSLEQILLAVASTQDAARAMYSSFGFKTFGTEPHAMKIGSEYVDEVYMILQLR